jgi:hypothetical protein
MIRDLISLLSIIAFFDGEAGRRFARTMLVGCLLLRFNLEIQRVKKLAEV